jgi:GMP synthase (glutamine-hydrolysing)
MAAPRFLIFDSEPKAAREKKRAQRHAPSAESFAQTLLKICPGAIIEQVAPAETDEAPKGGIPSFRAVFLSGSPLHFYKDTDDVRRIVEFMRAVFRSGVPSFGSCAGLQIATVAAGGRVVEKAARREAGIARLIYQTPQGLKHPLLSGRSPSFDAPAVHSDEVQELPAGAVLLASSKETKVQAAEIRVDNGLFWGVQYHPEISLQEVANALINERQELIDGGFVQARPELDRYVDSLSELDRNPNRLDLAWQLGISAELIDPWQRTTEIRNFIDMVLGRGPH